MEPRLIWFLLGPLHFGASPFLVCQHAVAIYSVFRLPRYPHSTSCCCCHQFPFSCFSHLRKKIVRIRASTFYSQKTNKKPQLLWQTNSRNCEPFVVGLNKRERETNKVIVLANTNLAEENPAKTSESFEASGAAKMINQILVLRC